MKRPPQSEQELHRAWAIQLIEEWHWCNASYLGRGLIPPAIAIDGSRTQLGHWEPSTRTISIAAEHIQGDPWIGVLETLRHEMAHQFVDEVLRVTGETPHGEAFRYACKKLRVSIAASGTGRENASDPVLQERQRALSRVNKLLALGESPNQNEAETALRMARRLLLEHNLSEVELEGREFRMRHIGKPAGRRHHYEMLLGGVLSEFFFVNVIWVDTYLPEVSRSAKVLEIHGTATNLDLAEYVHDYVNSLLQPLWDDYKKTHDVHGNRRRLEFFAGVVQGFWRSLKIQDGELAVEALVWRGDAALDQHYRWIYPNIRNVASGRGQRGAAYAEGVRRGKQVKLRRPVGGGGGGFGGRLGSGS